MPIPWLVIGGLAVARQVMRSLADDSGDPAVPPIDVGGRYQDDGDGYCLTLSGWPASMSGTLVVHARSADGGYLRAAHRYFADKDGDFYVAKQLQGESCAIYLPHGVALGCSRPKLVISVQLIVPSASGTGSESVSDERMTLDAIERPFSIVLILRPLIAMMKALALADGPLVREEVRYIREYLTSVFDLSGDDLQVLQRLLKDPQVPSMEEAAEMLQLRFPWLGADAIASGFQGVCEADGAINRQEAHLLEKLLRLLGMDGDYLDAFLASIKLPQLERIEECLALLGLSGEPSQAELRAAWRQAAREFHPDRYAATRLPDSVKATIARKCAEINAAYETLRDMLGYAA